MPEEIPQEQIRTIQDFSSLAGKVSQAIRIYNELYERRAQCYASLSGKKPGIFRRWLGKTSPYESGDPYEGLKNVNDRETRVVEVVEMSYGRMLPVLKAMDARWKKNQSHLFVIDTYFSKVIEAQKQFLSVEKHFISSKGEAGAIQEFLDSAKRYFSRLDENALLITREFGNFYSPKDFSSLLAKKQKENPVLAHLDLVGYLALFVAEFATISAFAHSLPDQFFDASKLPSPLMFSEFVIICYFLSIFEVPVKSWKAIKSSSAAIVNSLASLAASRT